MAAVQIYSASAGSGKTFTLVREYLCILFEKASEGQPTAFRNILAITFTNKATEEMKQRVVSSLKQIADGEDTPMLAAVRDRLPQVSDLSTLADNILRQLLRDFASFNIRTIDSFFQDILRSFARELDLPVNFNIELRRDDALEFAVDELMAQIGSDNDLTDWLRKYAFSRMDEDKGWNFRSQLIDISQELFDEELDLSGLKPTAARITGIRAELQAIIQEWERAISDAAQAILDDIAGRGLPLEAFDRNWRSNIDKARAAYRGEEIRFSATYQRELLGEKSPLTKGKLKEYNLHIDDYHSPVFEENSRRIYRLMTDDIRLYWAAREAVRNIYALGVIHRMNELLVRYRREKDVLFIIDATRLISRFIAIDDMPFLFEKLGNRIEYLFIDEFQDTSRKQWENMLPLLTNVLAASGRPNTIMLVGDAKQSIYRWRGGDSRLITGEAAASVRPFGSEVIRLEKNYRSLPKIVDFNNRFFEAVRTIGGRFGSDQLQEELTLTYGHVAQEVPEREPPGSVEIRLVEKSDAGWKDASLDRLLQDIDRLQQAGYALEEIAILVKTRREGIAISRHLQHNGIEVLSAETLLLMYDPAVRLVIAAFYYIADPETDLNYTNLLWQYRKYYPEKCGAVSANAVLSDFKERCLIDEWLAELASEAEALSFLSSYQVFERLAAILGINTAENLFVSQFRQLLFDFFRNDSPSTADFLEWWEEHKEDLSISLESGSGRINILTIHKAKGLEFPVVLLPYCSWNIFLNMFKDLLWLSDERIAGGSQLPYPAVKNLEDSIHGQAWERERTGRWMDTVNVLYVAMTRAEEVLWITLPSEKPGDKLPEHASLLICSVLAEWGVSTEQPGTALEEGRLERPARQDEKSTAEAEHVAGTGSFRPGLEDVAEFPLRSAFENAKTRIGTLVHDSLSLAGESSLEEAFLRAKQAKAYHAGETTQAWQHLERIQALPLFDKWLREADQYWNEQELWYKGNILRPDKILELKDSVIIVDYKTGGFEDRHHDQVRLYMSALQELMPAKPVEGYIIYTEDGSLEQVSMP
jgi:ATP-dependent exoDNAse (exonuclease V) beta subunit